jgi:predicted 2-oxoglutarate/Fe(II)-dependent dioxygenase YbiX/peroxiredoxin
MNARTPAAASYRRLHPGEPAPWFQQRCSANPGFVFHTAGGRYLLLCFFGCVDPAGQRALQLVRTARELFDDEQFSFFGVSIDPADEAQQRVAQSLPGVRHFWDTDGTVSRLYGALPLNAEHTLMSEFVRQWVVIDPGLQVVATLPMRSDGTEQAELLALLQSLPPVASYAGVDMHAPVLLLPRVLEPALCERLIAEFRSAGGAPSGFMRDVDGRTVMLQDPAHKRRRDHVIEDFSLRHLLQRRVQQKVLPALRRACSFEATRMERYLVGCYDAQDGGHFRPHRDNTTHGTAHRRFALSVNLNEEFDGGELCFPEYGPRRYKMPAGSAIVFSGSLLHAVTPVTHGCRYVFLPFLYDEAAAALRERNLVFLSDQDEVAAGSD